MFLRRLWLDHFRNYRSLDLTFPQPWTLLQGGNAQGKTNLLEAIHYLATSKSSHARVEREVVGWSASEEPIPHARIRGQVERAGQVTELEILFTRRAQGNGFTKQVRINGVARRSLDLLGLLRAVLFMPQDIELVTGSPSIRRRYLDVALCQIDREYCRHLARYQKVLAHRNSLLRQLREGGARPGEPRVAAELGFWDEQLAEHGAHVLARRYAFLARLEPLAAAQHHLLSGCQERLHILYLPTFDPGHLGPQGLQELRAGHYRAPRAPLSPPVPAELAGRLQAHLETHRARELAAGATLAGPHRDDLVFLLDDRELRAYGSRGQQRTAALALKLAEVRAMAAETGDTPVLLLDDVMSELDARRREMVLEALSEVDQAILTATDWEDFTPGFRAQAYRLQVVAGQVRAGGKD